MCEHRCISRIGLHNYRGDRDPGRLGHERQSQSKGLRTRSDDDVSPELGTGENWVFQLNWGGSKRTSFSLISSLL